MVHRVEGELSDADSVTEAFEGSHHSFDHQGSSDQWAGDMFVALPTAELITPSRQVEALTELEALRRAAYLGEQQKQRGHSIRQEKASSASIEHYADPLSPLKQRDLTALAALFQREDIYTIEVDISYVLLRLLPEPCWEEDPFEFLKDFL